MAEISGQRRETRRRGTGWQAEVPRRGHAGCRGCFLPHTITALPGPSGAPVDRGEAPPDSRLRAKAGACATGNLRTSIAQGAGDILHIGRAPQPRVSSGTLSSAGGQTPTAGALASSPRASEKGARILWRQPNGTASLPPAEARTRRRRHLVQVASMAEQGSEHTGAEIRRPIGPGANKWVTREESQDVRSLPRAFRASMTTGVLEDWLGGMRSRSRRGFGEASWERVLESLRAEQDRTAARRCRDGVRSTSNIY